MIEIVCPIYYEGIYVGNIGFGQFRDKAESLEEAYFSYLAGLTGCDVKKVKQLYNSQPTINDRQIRGAKLILEMTVARLCEENVFTVDYRDMIARVEQYIRDNVEKEITLESIAAYVYLNPTYLSTRFHEATGIPLFRYIQKERIARAVYLFSISSDSVAEIAVASGFKNPNYFSKVFRRETGYTPREYRQKLKDGEIVY